MKTAAGPDDQLLHLVFGGELENIDRMRFADLAGLDIVGIFPNYRTAYDAWRSKAQASVDNARMRYFIVHLHRLLEPDEKTGAPKSDDQSRPQADDVKKAKRQRNVLSRGIRRAGELPLLWSAAGKIGATYMRAVRATTTLTYEPGNPFEIYADRAPFILTGWHGQHFMVTFLMRPGDRARALVSKSRDGDASAAFMGSFGIEAIRGSGGRDRKRSLQKGGARAFLQLKRSLDEGVSIATIADISNSVARRCGDGVIALARASGRPIIAMGFATSRWIELPSWDRATIHLPFSRGAAVVAEPVDVPRDADAALVEAKRVEVENRINAATTRAYEIVGRRRDLPAPGLFPGRGNQMGPPGSGT